MFEKGLGIVIAGVFIGTAIVEISGRFTKDRADKRDEKQLPPNLNLTAKGAGEYANPALQV